MKNIFAQLYRAEVRAARQRNLDSGLWRESHMHSFWHLWSREGERREPFRHKLPN